MVAGQHRRAAAAKNEDEGSDQFSDVFFHGGVGFGVRPATDDLRTRHFLNSSHLLWRKAESWQDKTLRVAK
jgi:hypothetical protein